MASSSSMSTELSELVTIVQLTETTAAQLTDEETRIFQTVQTVLTVLALSANCVHLIVIYGFVTDLMPTHRFVISLAFAQMLAPWAIMVTYFPQLTTCQDEIQTSVLLTSHVADILSHLSLAVNHQVAVNSPFQYTTILSPVRTWAIVAVTWVVSVVLGHVHFFVRAADGPSSTTEYCDSLASHAIVAFGVNLALVLPVVVSSLAIYQRIWINQKPVGGRRQNKNIVIFGAITRMVVMLSSVVSWVPYLVVRILVWCLGEETRATLLATAVCHVIILIYCFLVPIYLGIRMSSISDEYLAIGRKMSARASEFRRNLRGRFGQGVPV